MLRSTNVPLMFRSKSCYKSFTLQKDYVNSRRDAIAVIAEIIFLIGVLKFASQLVLAKFCDRTYVLQIVLLPDPGNCLPNEKRRHPDSNWGIMDLQSTALPLGYVATLLITLHQYTKICSIITRVGIKTR